MTGPNDDPLPELLLLFKAANSAKVNLGCSFSTFSNSTSSAGGGGGGGGGASVGGKGGSAVGGKGEEGSVCSEGLKSGEPGPRSCRSCSCWICD